MSWFIFAIITALFWGIAPIFAKLGLVKVDPIAGLTVRTIGVALALAIINVAGSKLEALRAVGVKGWLFLLAEGLCASLLGHYAYFYALKSGKVSGVVPVTAAYPLITVLLGWLLLREQLTLGRVIGGVLIVAGVILIKRF